MPRTPPQPAAYRRAYELRRDGMSYSEIADEMAGPPHHCGGRTTAYDWVQAGYRQELEHGGPADKRVAQRALTAATRDRLRVLIFEDVTAGRLDRATAYKLVIELLRDNDSLLGLRRPVQARKVKITGSAPVQLDPVVAASLAALPDELREELESRSRD